MEILSLSTNQINQNGYHKTVLTREKIGALYTFPIDFTPEDCLAYLTSKAVIDEHRNNVAIQNTCSNNASRLELRGQYLQQYFPETFAFIARALNKANLETKTRFEELGLDYAKWQTGPEAQTFKIGGQEYTVKLWNRVPQESLFDGSYTTCCTALDGGNGGSMANYMLNTAINVVEVKDKNGKVVAMSRCYIADVGGKQTFVIENIEATLAK